MDSSAILLNSLLLKELGCHAAAWKRGCNRIFQIWSVPACYGGVKQSETVKSVDWIITEVIYQLQKVSENPGWKENGTRLFGSFQQKKNLWGQRSIWKVSRVFPDGIGSFSNDYGDGQRGRQKSNRFITQHNNFARASRFFVHFFTVLARLRRENA